MGFFWHRRVMQKIAAKILLKNVFTGQRCNTFGRAAIIKDRVNTYGNIYRP
jgi:hypothetical protein